MFNVLPAYEHLLSKLETAKSTHENNPRLVTFIKLAWKKLDEYYQESDLSKVSLIAAVLDPRVKLRFFENNWKTKWLTGAKEKLNEFLAEFVHTMGISEENEDDSFGNRADMPDSQESNTTFGSWRQLDIDDDAPSFRTEW